MCHGKEMPTDYESKRNGPDHTYTLFSRLHRYIISNIIRKLGWFRQQNPDYLVFFKKLILQQ